MITPGEFIAASLLYIVWSVAVFTLGMVFGAIISAAHISQSLKRIRDEAAQSLLPPPTIIPDSDAWRKGKTQKQRDDDQWLRDQLGGNDNPKDKK